MKNFIEAVLHFMLARSKKNPISIVYLLLKFLKVKVTKKTIQNTLLNHPAFPTLLSISDGLNEWHIDNLALQLESIDQLRELPIPFIAHFNTGKGSFVLVYKLTATAISYREGTRHYAHESWDKFKLKWSGTVLLAEANQRSGEYKFKENHLNQVLSKVRILFLSSTCIILLSSLLYSFSAFLVATDWALLGLKTIGFILSLVLVLKQLGNSNEIIDRLCTISNQTDCNSVLNSPAAKLWGWLSWSYIGLAYFASGLLSFTILIVNPDSRTLIYSLPFFSLPIIGFSIYYQAKVIRSWCALCLGVQGILLMEVALVVSKIRPLPTYFQPYFLLGITMVVPIAGLILIIPLVNDKIKSSQEHDELLKIKRNSSLFNFFLSEQVKMQAMPSTLMPVRLGNPAAANTITLITNPFCHPCRAVHKALETLLHYDENLNAQIVFFACDDRIRRLSDHMLTLSRTNDMDTLLSSWFDQPELDDDAWIKLNPIRADLPTDYKDADQHCEWCRQAGITSTPTIFINGKQLPDLYNLSELRWLLDSTN